MKKIANYLIALAIAAFTFTSCEDVPSPFGTVVQPDSGDEVVIEPQGSGTKSDPYNVAGALEFISGLGADVPSDKEIYVKGYVTSIKEQFSAQYGNAQFTMSDTKEGANTFTFFRGLYLGNKKWVEGDILLAEGDEVIVCGKVVNYKGNTPETVQNAAYTYSINGKSEGGGGGDTPSGDAKGTGTADDPFNIAAAIKKCQEIGVTVSTEKYYVKGIVVKGGTVSGGYGNLTFTLGDTKDATDIFTAYQVAGSDGEKLADGYQVNAGSEVVVYGPMYNFQGNTPETAGKSAAYIVTIDGKKTSDSGGGGGGTPSGDATKVTVQEFLAAAESTDVWYELTGTIEHLEDETYNNSTMYGNFDLVDETGKVYVYGVLAEKGGQKGQFATLMADKGIKDGCKITIIGNRGSFKGDAQVTNAYFVKVEAGSSGGSGGGQGGGESSSLLTNGDFETWADGQPTGWKSASSASSATLAQSTDAHGGKYSCNVNGGGTQNKRLASKEITLAAGSYNFSFWVKATTEDKAQVRPGYAIVEGGTINSSSGYKYGSYADISTGWKQVSYDFTLDAETTVCLLVMNPKANDYSSGKDVLVDDATLTKK